MAFAEYVLSIRSADEQIARLAAALVETTRGWRFEPVVSGLRTLRGIDTTSAIGLVAESGDIQRFAHLMKRAGGGFDYCYNAQAAVDDTAHIIVAAELTNSGADSRQLPAVLAAVKETIGSDPEQVLADAGDRSEAVFETLCDHPAELIVALGREGRKAVIINAKKRPLAAAMAEKFKSQETQQAYRRRKWLSEPPNGWVKNGLGFRQFSMRGLSKAQAEWKLVCAALNLRRMAQLTAY